MNKIRISLKKIFIKIVDESYSNQEREILEYVFVGCSFEIIKLILIFIILIVSGYFKEGLIICSVMFLSKPFIGGYHEETQFKCLLSTVASIFFLILLSNNCSFSPLGNVLIIVLSIFSVWNKAPVIDDKRPITKKKLINRNRIIGTSILSIFGILSIAIYNTNNLYILITCTILFQALIMFKKNIKLIK